MAVVRRTLVWMSRYQSLIRRSVWIGLRSMYWVDSAELLSLKMPTSMDSSESARISAIPRPRRLVMDKLEWVWAIVGAVGFC